MKKAIGFGLAALPLVSFAAITSLDEAIVAVGALLNSIVPLLFAIATVWLLWNIVKYIEAGTGDSKTREAARDAIILAVVLLFVMVSIWGLVNVLKGTFDLDTTTPELPTPFEQ